MGDRRIADRRAPEEGVVKIETKKLIVYAIIVVLLASSIIANIILGILYTNYKKLYTNIINGEDESINYDEELDDDFFDTSDIGENEYSCNLVIDGEKVIKVGESATYTISATDINADDGIIMFETVLDYDSNVFDCEIVNNENSEWNKIGFIENYLTMARKEYQPNSEDQAIVSIKLTAKENTNIGEQEIKLTQIKFTMDEEKTFMVDDQSLQINVLEN